MTLNYKRLAFQLKQPPLNRLTLFRGLSQQQIIIKTLETTECAG